MTTRETLEALIPAIMAIEGGYYENVCEFISEANKGLSGIGSPYRFESTSTIAGAVGWEGDYVDTTTVVESES